MTRRHKFDMAARLRAEIEDLERLRRRGGIEIVTRNGALVTVYALDRRRRR